MRENVPVFTILANMNYKSDFTKTRFILTNILESNFNQKSDWIKKYVY